MLQEYEDTNEFWEIEAKNGLVKLSTSSTWVFSRHYWKKRFLDIVQDAISLVENNTLPLRILKTDLWNEGIDTQRNVLGTIRSRDAEFFGIDISKFTASKAANNNNLKALQSSIDALPFRNDSFNLLLDMSTIDHLPLGQREKAIWEYQRVLESNGILVLVFDKRSILFSLTLLKNVLSGKWKGNEKSYAPSQFGPDSVIRIKGYLESQKFEILGEGIVALNWGNIVGALFSGAKSKVFRFLIDRKSLQRAIYKLEISRVSIYLSSFAEQYFIICRKQ